MHGFGHNLTRRRRTALGTHTPYARTWFVYSDFLNADYTLDGAAVTPADLWLTRTVDPETGVVTDGALDESLLGVEGYTIQRTGDSETGARNSSAFTLVAKPEVFARLRDGFVALFIFATDATGEPGFAPRAAFSVRLGNQELRYESLVEGDPEAPDKDLFLLKDQIGHSLTQSGGEKAHIISPYVGVRFSPYAMSVSVNGSTAENLAGMQQAEADDLTITVTVNCGDATTTAKASLYRVVLYPLSKYRSTDLPVFTD